MREPRRLDLQWPNMETHCQDFVGFGGAAPTFLVHEGNELSYGEKLYRKWEMWMGIGKLVAYGGFHEVGCATHVLVQRVWAMAALIHVVGW